MAFWVISKKYFRYFNGTAIAAFFKIPFAPSASLFPSKSASYLKDLQLPVFVISVLKLVLSVRIIRIIRILEYYILA